MNDNKNKSSTSSSARSWDTYWRGDQSSHAYSSSGVNHEDISAWWAFVFEQLTGSERPLKMLDIASGNGALPEIALGVWPGDEIEITAADISAAAIENISSRFPSINGVVADAANMPFKAGEFDLLTSQFGIEYAGLDALDSAITLLAPGGTLILMMHIKEGLIHGDCLANRNALQALEQSNFVSLARAMFEHGFAAVAGADRQAYEQAATKLAPAITATENIIEQYGVEIAGGSILKLYNDVGMIHSKLPNYVADDVLPWLDTMQDELTIYADRMDTMLNAAVSQAEFEQISENLLAGGLSLLDNAALFDKQSQQPLAWILRAEKNSS